MKSCAAHGKSCAMPQPCRRRMCIQDGDCLVMRWISNQQTLIKRSWGDVNEPLGWQLMNNNEPKGGRVRIRRGERDYFQVKRWASVNWKVSVEWQQTEAVKKMHGKYADGMRWPRSPPPRPTVSFHQTCIFRVFLRLDFFILRRLQQSILNNVLFHDWWVKSPETGN